MRSSVHVNLTFFVRPPAAAAILTPEKRKRGVYEAPWSAVVSILVQSKSWGRWLSYGNEQPST